MDVSISIESVAALGQSFPVMKIDCPPYMIRISNPAQFSPAGIRCVIETACKKLQAVPAESIETKIKEAYYSEKVQNMQSSCFSAGR